MSPLIAGFAAPLLCGVPDSADQVRPAISLDGEWNLTVAGKPNVYKLSVPGSWQSQVDELRSYVGRADYSREVVVPDSWRSKRVFIHLGAVDYFAEVFVNSTKVGDHEGGYTPVSYTHLTLPTILLV